jgi:8-oxo-dGTP diphosphatase
MTFFRRLGRITYTLAWPALFIYLRIGARTRVAVISEGHILLVEGWMDDGRWGLPGGGLHRGELPAHGAVREVAEETNVTVSPESCVLLGSEWRSRKGLKFFCHFFSATANGLPEVRAQRGEIVAVRWFPLDQINTLEHKLEVDRALELLAQQT